MPRKCKLCELTKNRPWLDEEIERMARRWGSSTAAQILSITFEPVTRQAVLRHLTKHRNVDLPGVRRKGPTRAEHLALYVAFLRVREKLHRAEERERALKRAIIDLCRVRDILLQKLDEWKARATLNASGISPPNPPNPSDSPPSDG